MCHTGFAQNSKLTGTWQGVDEKKQTGAVEFKEKTLIFNFNGQISSPCSYKADFTKNPVWMDIVMKNDSKSMTMYALVKFIDGNTIKWEMFPGATARPTKFSSASNEVNSTTIILKKVK
jgi:uncharacterized protein (TIGR03067 family)